MTREEIENEIQSIDAVLASRKTAASVAGSVVIAAPVAESPVLENAVNGELAHEESIFDEEDGFAEIAEAAAPAEVQVAPQKASRGRRKFFTLKKLALASAAIACAGFFLGQGNSEKPAHEVAEHSTTTDAFTPRAVAQGPVPVPVQRPMSSVSVVSVPVAPVQPPVVKSVEVEPPLKQVTAQKAQVVKPVVVAPKTPVVDQEAPKTHAKRQAAVHHALPVVAKSVTHKSVVKVAEVKEPVKVERMALVQPSDDDDISSLKRARELN